MKTFRMDTTQTVNVPQGTVIVRSGIEVRLEAMEAKLSALETKLNQATSVCNCTNRLLGLEQAVEALGRQLATLRAER